MTEKEIKLKFVNDYLNDFEKLLKVKNLRLYALEFPIKTTDGIKYADIVLEIKENESPMNNKIIILEWKKGLIDTGVVDQVLRYSEYVRKQLYRKKRASSFICGEEFSKWERNIAKENKVFCLQYDSNWNLRIV